MKSNQLLALLILLLAFRHVPQLAIDVCNRNRRIVASVQCPVRAIYIMFAYSLLMLIALHRIYSAPPRIFWTVAGILVIAIGCLLGIMGLRSLAKQYSEELVVYDNAQLVTKGIYAVVRHPLRLGLSVELLGACLILLDPLAFVLWAGVMGGQMWRTVYEERLLRSCFGESADLYMKSVPAINLLAGLFPWRVRCCNARNVGRKPFCGGE